jgi:hypothetical protein
VAIVGLPATWDMKGRKLTLLLPRRNKDINNNILEYIYVTGMECSDVQIVVAG